MLAQKTDVVRPRNQESSSSKNAAFYGAAAASIGAAAALALFCIKKQKVTGDVDEEFHRV